MYNCTCVVNLNAVNIESKHMGRQVYDLCRHVYIHSPQSTGTICTITTSGHDPKSQHC